MTSEQKKLYEEEVSELVGVLMDIADEVMIIEDAIYINPSEMRDLIKSQCEFKDPLSEDWLSISLAKRTKQARDLLVRIHYLSGSIRAMRKLVKSEKKLTLSK